MSAKAPDSIDALVGHNIRIQRMARRVTQTDLAAQLGVTFQQVQKYEKGINRVGSGRLMRIADVFDLPIAALFDGATDRRRRIHGAFALRLIAEKEPLRLVQAFARIKNRRFRRALVALVENVAAMDVRD
ncbi:MAG: helix-turn-helix transcriptional regulator [Xanthobacteraceae bacterium]|nr:helix-turn-helix transcriptional regulator [Xanthobacteraceae bacterium]